MTTVTANLMVESVSEALTFYAALGFDVVSKLPESNPVWALVTLGEARLMFQGRSSLESEFPALKDVAGGGALTLWFSTADVKALFERATSVAKVIKPYGVTDYNGANEFVVQDPNGFILHFSDMKL